MAGLYPSWTRPQFSAGGGDATLFYVVFGRFDPQVPLDSKIYRCESVPEELSVEVYGPDQHPEVVDGFRQGYLWEQLQETDPTLASQIAAEDSCLLIKGTFPDPKDLNYLRQSVGFLSYLLDTGCPAIFDPQMFTWWSPGAWREKIFTPFKTPRHHAIVLISEDGEDHEWIHTRGMRKFGRPDLSIHQVPPQHRQACIDLCQQLIEHQALGAVIAEGEPVSHPKLPKGMTCHHQGDLDDPDFNNVHVEIRWSS